MEEHGTQVPLLTDGSESHVSYWGKNAARYRRASHFFGGALILFSVLFLLFFTAAFRADSFFYFLKDLQAIATSLPSENETVYFTASEERATVLPFRGNIASVGGEGVEVNTVDGKQLLFAEHSFAAPRAVASRKYLLAYDFGGTTFSVCNSYAELFVGSTDSPIYYASVCDKGSFLLITGTAAGGSQVLLYDEDFNLRQRFSRVGATVGAALSPNGKLIALAGSVVEEGNTHTVVDLFAIGDTEPLLTRRQTGEFPLTVGFTDNKHVTLLTQSTLYMFTAEGKTLQSVSFDGQIPTAFSCNENGCAVALANADVPQATVLAFTKKGKSRGSMDAPVPVTALALSNDALYAIANDSTLRRSNDGEVLTAKIEAGAIGIAVDARSVRVLYRGASVVIDFAS